MKRTNRGFRIFSEFKDTYGSVVRVQESSTASAFRCWVFCDNDPRSFKDPSPHLSPRQARLLAAALVKFADWAAPKKKKKKGGAS